MEICTFEKFTLAEKLYAKALGTFETYLSVSNNLSGKKVLSVVLPTIFDDSLRVTFSMHFL